MRESATETPRAWSFAAAVNSFDTVRDDEGRPVLEGRAPIALREGVPMVMRRCRER